MLGDSPVAAVVPTRDIDKARPYYEDQLGLKVLEEFPLGAILLGAGNGTQLLLYQTQVNIPAEHTVAAFMVDDAEAMVSDLETRGVTFEEYDLKEFGYEEGGKGKIIDAPDGSRTAWFTDPEGNILALNEMAG